MQYGEDAIKEGMGSGGGGGGMSDIFDMLSGGGRRQQQRERRGENVVHRLKASLEEMYSGAVRKLSLSRNIKCDTCGGCGTKSGKRYQCDVGHQPDIVSDIPVLMRQVDELHTLTGWNRCVGFMECIRSMAWHLTLFDYIVGIHTAYLLCVCHVCSLRGRRVHQAGSQSDFVANLDTLCEFTSMFYQGKATIVMNVAAVAGMW